MKSITLPCILALLFCLAPPATAADPAPTGTTPAQCLDWFKSWGEKTKASLAIELKSAKALDVDKRDLHLAVKPIDDLVSLAGYYCSRLEGVKIKAPSPIETSMVNCERAFTQWENEKDAAYAEALFLKKITDQTPEQVAAQDVVRREAMIARILCKTLDRLH
jgi:hypothetical protein